MHLELSLVISRALGRLLHERLTILAEPVRASALERLFAVAEAEVEDCPPAFAAELTSAAAFEAAKYLKRFFPGDDLSPISLAGLIMDRLKDEKEFEQLQIEVGGDGYLNATFSGEFKSLFLSRVFVDWRKLFTRESVFSAALPEALARFPVDFDLLRKLAERRAVNDDLKEFQAAVGPDNNWSPDDRLMFLAALGNRELEVRPYLMQLKSRQNVPWYLTRFRKDASAAVRSMAGGNAKKSRELRDLTPEPCFSTPLAPFLANTLSLLLRFRARLFSAVERRRPELFLHLLIEIVNAWYSAYQRPQLRRLVAESKLGAGSDPETRLFYSVTRTALEAVNHGLSIMDFSCERKDSVLDFN